MKRLGFVAVVDEFVLRPRDSATTSNCGASSSPPTHARRCGPTRPALARSPTTKLQDFLFAVISAPEPIHPSEWLPIIFTEHDAGYTTLEEAQLILGHIMALYNDINTSIVEERVAVPHDCHVRPQALDNLDDSAPIARWSHGSCVVSSSRDLVGRALLEMKHECDAWTRSVATTCA